MIGERQVVRTLPVRTRARGYAHNVHAAVRIGGHAVCDRTPPRERSLAVRRRAKHDQIDVVVFGEIEQCCSRIARLKNVQRDALCGQMQRLYPVVQTYPVHELQA